MFTSVLMIEKALTSADVEFVTTLHGDEAVSFHVLLQPRGDQADRLLRAIDDVALGELDEAAHERETPEGKDAAALGGRLWRCPSPPCTHPAARRWAASSRTIRWTR
ncbi:hypothetical protein SAV14893_013860 [Streptomyces avermitilis]|uniref:Uncharacterized protein n=1 Tax=Streptomyces avermitilis TaxID=33903 RepID=A0A4D4N0B3_STRAX|nr:hypothetical protein SAVMC3_26050 [Streptomyces avermitilis]GDY61993.1 hypothetical protein SAV14893_013860 [Streptomyces avermitilis]GDY77900.1 hypothetical protein SAV31267_073850 [Streptomyces avermitilis]